MVRRGVGCIGRRCPGSPVAPGARGPAIPRASARVRTPSRPPWTTLTFHAWSTQSRGLRRRRVRRPDAGALTGQPLTPGRHREPDPQHARHPPRPHREAPLQASGHASRERAESEASGTSDLRGARRDSGLSDRAAPHQSPRSFTWSGRISSMASLAPFRVVELPPTVLVSVRSTARRTSPRDRRRRCRTSRRTPSALRRGPGQAPRA